MITLRKNATDRVLELGGGSQPIVHPQCLGGNDVHVDVRACVDAQGRPCVDFSADFNEPLPIKNADFDAVVSIFCIEHLQFHKVPQFISECFRVVKPGGKVVIVSPNTEAQMDWVKKHPNGWDGKAPFEAMSEVLYGSQDYEANTHKVFLSPAIIHDLFLKAGFVDVLVVPYGERKTDMCVTGVRPQANVATSAPQAAPPAMEPKLAGMSREEMFDRHYWNGGSKVGGYAREGYWDFPVHHVTAAHIMLRKPKSVLELGAARGYILKRIQDAGIPGAGIEISNHCYLTRVCNGIRIADMCKTWESWMRSEVYPTDPVELSFFDLCYSVAVLEHIPEEHVPHVIREMSRVCRRGLHGVDFGGKDDGFDQTHFTLRSKTWWEQMFATHAPGWPVEIVDKEELEQGAIPLEVARGDGKVKLNLGCHTTMHHHGWINIDANDHTQFAAQHGYRFLKHDLRSGLPYKTGEVDLIHMSHVLEHLTPTEGVALIRECRRVIKPGGAVRIAVPDVQFLVSLYLDGDLRNLNEICDEATIVLPESQKFFSLLASGHQTGYDEKALGRVLGEAGFRWSEVLFRQHFTEAGRQIVMECNDMHPCLSLYMEAVP